MLSKEKIVQALIEAVNDVADQVVEANGKAQDYKTKFQTLNPDLAGTVISAADLTAINAWLTDLNILANSAVVSSAKAKQQSTHGTKALG